MHGSPAAAVDCGVPVVLYTPPALACTAPPRRGEFYRSSTKADDKVQRHAQPGAARAHATVRIGHAIAGHTASRTSAAGSPPSSTQPRILSTPHRTNHPPLASESPPPKQTRQKRFDSGPALTSHVGEQRQAEGGVQMLASRGAGGLRTAAADANAHAIAQGGEGHRHRTIALLHRHHHHRVRGQPGREPAMRPYLSVGAGAVAGTKTRAQQPLVRVRAGPKDRPDS